MNTGLLVLVIALGWSALSVAVAVAVGAMAHARDVVPEPPDLRIRDEGFRTAV